jgi:hypothetical protein
MPREDLGHELQRDVAVQTRIAGAIDLAHSAGTEETGDFVLSDPRTRRQCHGYFTFAVRSPS